MNFPDAGDADSYELDGSDGSDRSDMRLAEVVARLRQGWRAVVLGALGMFVFMVALMKVTNPVYSVEATVTASNSPINTTTSMSSGGAGIAASLLGGGLNGSPEFVRFLARLQTPPVAAKMEADHHVLRLLYPEQWNAAEGRWNPKSGPVYVVRNAVFGFFGLPAAHPPTVEDLTIFLQKELVVKQTDSASVYSVSLRYKNAKLGADILRWALAAAEALEKSEALGPTREFVAYIAEQAKYTQDPTLRLGLSQMYEQQQQRAMVLSSHAAYGAQVIGPPQIPTRPIWPSPILGGVIALVIGAIGGAVVAVMYPRLSTGLVFPSVRRAPGS